MGMWLYKHGPSSLNDALEYFQKSAYQANLSEDQDLQVKSLFNMALLHESMGVANIPQVNALYTKILEIDPLNHMALNNLAVNLKSLEMVKRAHGLSHSEVTTTTNLGLLEYQEGQLESSMKSIQNAYDLSQKEQGGGETQDINELISISRLKIACESNAPLPKIAEY